VQARLELRSSNEMILLVQFGGPLHKFTPGNAPHVRWSELAEVILMIMRAGATYLTYSLSVWSRQAKTLYSSPGLFVGVVHAPHYSGYRGGS
jgi:hypothetical protein